MTNTEAIETLRANYPDACYEQLREAVDVAISSLKRSEIVHSEWIQNDNGTWSCKAVIHGFRMSSMNMQDIVYAAEQICEVGNGELYKR